MQIVSIGCPELTLQIKWSVRLGSQDQQVNIAILLDPNLLPPIYLLDWSSYLNKLADDIFVLGQLLEASNKHDINILIGGNFFFDLVGTVIDVIADAFEDKLEKEIFY